MLKVNCEKFLGEIEALKVAIAENDKKAKDEAIAVGEARGWKSENMVQKLYELILQEPEFNVDCKKAKLDEYMAFVDEVEEPVVVEVVEEVKEVEEPVVEPIVDDIDK